MRRSGMLAAAFLVVCTGTVLAQGYGPSFAWGTYDEFDANGNPVVITSPRFWTFQDQPDGPNTNYCMGAYGTALWYPEQMYSATLKYRIGTNGVFPDEEKETYALHSIEKTYYGQGGMVSYYKWGLGSTIGKNNLDGDPSTYPLSQGQSVSCGFRVVFPSSIYRLGNATVSVKKSI